MFFILKILLLEIKCIDDNIDENINGGYDASCNDRGTCDIATGLCTCNDGFTGIHCEING